MNKLSKIIGLNIKLLRRKKGLSQEKLADEAGLHRTYVGKVERGEKNLTIQTLFELTSSLDVSLEEFFSLVDSSLSPRDKTYKDSQFIAENTTSDYSPIHELIDIMQNANKREQGRIIDAVKFMVDWSKER